MECTFCRIIAKEIPSRIVYEDKFTIAILDREPITEGHTLVIPKKHYRNLYDISEADLKRVVVVAKRLAAIYQTALGTDGVNLLHASNDAAGQSEFHYHMHVIPRYKSDGIETVCSSGKRMKSADETVYSKIKSAMKE